MAASACELFQDSCVLTFDPLGESSSLHLSCVQLPPRGDAPCDLRSWKVSPSQNLQSPSLTVTSRSAETFATLAALEMSVDTPESRYEMFCGLGPPPESHQAARIHRVCGRHCSMPQWPEPPPAHWCGAVDPPQLSARPSATRTLTVCSDIAACRQSRPRCEHSACSLVTATLELHRVGSSAAARQSTRQVSSMRTQ